MIIDEKWKIENTKKEAEGIPSASSAISLQLDDLFLLRSGEIRLP